MVSLAMYLSYSRVVPCCHNDSGMEVVFPCSARGWGEWVLVSKAITMCIHFVIGNNTVQCPNSQHDVYILRCVLQKSRTPFKNETEIFEDIRS